MKRKSPIKTILVFMGVGTLLSILVFFSISFLTLLEDLSTFNPAANRGKYHFELGFPFTYYREFFLEGNTYQSTWWSPIYLLVDCFITWISVAVPYTMIKFRKSRLALTERKAEDQLIDQ